jgi:hypothetical protein
MNIDQKIVEAVAADINKVSVETLNLAHATCKLTWEDRDGLPFMEAGAAIVETTMPSELKEVYGNWIDADVHRWANWIRGQFGEQWGDIADVIADEGW